MPKHHDLTTKDDSPIDPSGKKGRSEDTCLALVVLWFTNEPRRVGEALLVPSGSTSKPFAFGRAEVREADPYRVHLLRQRPGENSATAPIENAFVSRTQLRLRRERAGLRVENAGKREILGPAGSADVHVLSPGDWLEIKGQVLFLCVERPFIMPALIDYPAAKMPVFGEPDEHGFVGESPVAWQLREQSAFLAGRAAHVLLLGPSGSGKEVVAQAIHTMSARSKRALVARNAATLPAGLIDAELFGNVKNYPNPGMADRAGLIGEANGSTLFLDEIGELPEGLQAHLLRVLDERGEYQRLGEATRRNSDFRFVGATNRAVQELKHDLAARLRLRLTIPDLNARSEDVPLLARFLLRRTAAGDHAIGRRFFEGWDGMRGEPRLSLDLVRVLATHTYTTHVRELDTLLWHSLLTSPGDTAELTDVVRAELANAGKRGAGVEPGQVSADDIRDALRRANGVQERAWRELGLASRYVLKRLIKKHGIQTDDSDDD